MLLKNQQVNNVIKAVTAKIITELKAVIHDFLYIKEILKDFATEQSKEK